MSLPTRVEVQDNKRLKLIQADNELSTKELELLAKDKGFIFRFTPPFNPEAKGGGERINRTLFDNIRALLIESKLPKRLWAEALMSAVYLYNRTPHSSINFKTPYEAKYKAKPNIANIKIWGSLCYKKEPKEFLSKLDSRANPYYLVGYTSNNLYRLIDLKTSKVTLARDVKVLEGIYKKDKTSNLEEDLEIEDSNSPTSSNLGDNSPTATINAEQDNKRIVVGRNPKVVISTRKDTTTELGVNSSNLENNNNLDIEDYLIEDVLYTSKVENDPKNYF